MRVLITGGAGFIGSHLADALIKKGHQLMILDDFSGADKVFLPKQANVYNVDIHDYRKTEVLFNKFSPAAIFHLAARIDARALLPDQKRYATDSMNILRLCQIYGARRLIFSSSAAVYGQNKNLPLRESERPSPFSDYGFSKHNFETHLISKFRRDSLKVVVLRYANVYGPRQGVVGEGGVVAVFCRRLLARKPLVINGSGRQTRDFIFVSDVVDSNLAALSSIKPWAVYNVSTGRETSINDLAKKLRVVSGVDAPIKHTAAVKDEVKRSSLSNVKIRRNFGWRPRVGLDEGLKMTWEWFRERP